MLRIFSSQKVGNCGNSVELDIFQESELEYDTQFASCFLEGHDAMSENRKCNGAMEWGCLGTRDSQP